MLKKDKLHLILRAKHGSQILKYQNPSGPLPGPSMIPAGNPFMTSDGMPTVQLSSIDTSNISPLSFTDPLHGVDTRSSFKRFMDKNKDNFKQAGQIAGQVGFDVANGLINQGRANQINSSGVDTAFGVADTVGNVAGKINPVLGAAVKGVTTIFKGIDTLFGSKSKEFGVNKATVSQVGGSYGGSTATITDAASKAGKKYGLFSSGARRRANALIDKAALQQNTMTEIAEEASDQRSMVNDLAYTQNNMDLNGGYDQRYIRAAKHGVKLQDKIDFVIARRLQSRVNVDTKQVEEFKDGGVIEWKPEIVWDVESFKEGGQIEWKPEIVWEPEIQEFKEGGKTDELETPEIEETNQKNIIPEGALHKNKHHMEHTEGLTQKGIPVVDNDGEQQAEIELDEIIFTLEVTKKLEELYKDGSDEAAIEAGKLLVKEILFNTDDRTGLIAKCEKGGKLNELS